MVNSNKIGAVRWSSFMVHKGKKYPQATVESLCTRELFARNRRQKLLNLLHQKGSIEFSH
jgi:hypothetical protein